MTRAVLVRSISMILIFLSQFSSVGDTFASNVKIAFTVKPSIIGNINGDGSVDMKDAILALQLLIGMNPSGIRSEYASSGADVNNDNKIGIDDVLYILQVVSGLRTEVIVTFTISGTISAGGAALSGATISLAGASSATTTTDASGNYTFTDLANGSYTITPSKAGYTFTPQTVTVNAGNVTQDFGGVSTAPTGMVAIPAGSFLMGDANSEGMGDELPAHTVTVSAFYLDKYEVTKALWDEVYAWATAHGYSFDNAGAGTGASHPVRSVSWYDVVKWLNARSEREGRAPVYYTDVAQTTIYKTGQVDVTNAMVKLTANGYRLPTEAEWEYAARAGTTTRFYTGDCISTDQANYDGNAPWSGCPAGQYRRVTTAVGSFASNPWELNDMAGNVWEWTLDWYGHYSSSAVTNPQGPDSGSGRVFRGGSWYHDAGNLRSTFRSVNWPFGSYDSLGFRAALSQPFQP